MTTKATLTIPNIPSINEPLEPLEPVIIDAGGRFQLYMGLDGLWEDPKIYVFAGRFNLPLKLTGKVQGFGYTGQFLFKFLAVGYDEYPYIRFFSQRQDEDDTQNWTQAYPNHEIFPSRTSSTIVKNLAFSPDGSMLAGYISRFFSVGNDSYYEGELFVLRPLSWEKVPYTPAVNASKSNISPNMAFSPDSTLLAFPDDDGLKVFNTATWELEFSDTSFDTVQGCAFNSDGSWLAVVGTDSPVLKVYNTSTWAEISGVPTPTYSAATVKFSPDDAYLAIGRYWGTWDVPQIIYDTDTWDELEGTPEWAPRSSHLDYQSTTGYLAFPYYEAYYNYGVRVYDQDDWSDISGLFSLVRGPSGGVCFSPDGKWLAAGTTTRPYYGETFTPNRPLFLVDTGTWSKVNLADFSFFQDRGVYALTFSGWTKPYCKQRLVMRFREGLTYKITPEFSGIAVVHDGGDYFEGPFDGDQLTIYKRKADDGSFIKWQDIAPLTDEHQIAIFSYGGQWLFVGNTKLESGAVYRLSLAQKYEYYGTFETGSDLYKTLCLSISNRGKYLIHSHYDPFSDSCVYYSYDQPGYNSWFSTASADIVKKRFIHRGETSPDGKYLFRTANYDSAYDQSPYVWAYENTNTDVDGKPSYTPVTVNRNSNDFGLSQGLAISWSPNSEFVWVWKYIFKYDEIEEEFSIVDELSGGADPTIKAAWSPDSQYLAVSSTSGDANIYKRSGDSFSLIETIAITNGTVTALSWDKTGTIFFGVFFSECGVGIQNV